MSYKYIFGPIASRRLGVSLGVDLISEKICTQDCPYCEAGWTKELTTERKEYVPVADVIAELKELLSQNPYLDYVTFSGTGEPTLNTKIGEVIEFIKTQFPQYKVCVLTNGTLLGYTDVAKALANADLVVPNLDASCPIEFIQINRPAEGITFEEFVHNLIGFCQNFQHEIFLELFIAPNINDSADSIARFVEILKELKVTKVQLNSLDRPGCDDTIKPATAQVVRGFIQAFEPIVPVEAVGAYRYKSKTLRGDLPTEELCARILTNCRRRQLTMADLVETLAVEPQELDKALNLLLSRGLLESESGERGRFFGFFG